MEKIGNYLSGVKGELAPEFWVEMHGQCFICYQSQGKGKTIGEFVQSLNGECVPCKEKQYAGFVRGLAVTEFMSKI